MDLYSYVANCTEFMGRISGAGFLRLSGIGTGSLGRLLSFLVMMGFTSIESVNDRKQDAIILLSL